MTLSEERQILSAIASSERLRVAEAFGLASDVPDSLMRDVCGEEDAGLFEFGWEA
jgi:hypothetical protein